MALGFAPALADDMLDAYTGVATMTATAAVWVKLHLGDPGAAGTTAPATEATRQQATFAAASGGVASNSAAVTWTSVSTTETYTHYSLWTASTAGTFLGSGTVTGGAVTAGTNFTLPIGDIDITLNVAA